ncbi:MAG: hypothetical protein ACREQC_00180 [Candidatus Binataceae bacterium]
MPAPADLAAKSLNVRPPSVAGAASIPQFEYVGRTALTVVSPLSGRHYRFARPGARLDADIRDRSWLAFVPNLKRTN